MNFAMMIFCFLLGVILPIISYLNDMFFGTIMMVSFLKEH